MTVRDGAPKRLSRMVQLPTVSAELDRARPRRLRPLPRAPRRALPARARAPRVRAGHRPRTPVPLARARRRRPRRAHGALRRRAGRSRATAGRFPPFEGRIHDGSVHGRGTLDDKGPLLVLLEAVENLLADGFTPARDVYLSFGGNEESHGAAAAAIAAPVPGARHHARGSCSTRAAPSSTRPCRSCTVPAAMVGVGEKGVLTVRLDGSRRRRPRLRSAGTTRRPRASPARVHRLSPNPFPKRMPRSMRAMLAHLRAAHARRRPGCCSACSSRSPG